MPRWLRRTPLNLSRALLPSSPFTAGERAELAAHGFALFAGRVVFDARPPLSRAAIDDIEQVCAGPLPPALRELWSITAGGRLDYDLSVGSGDHQLGLSWTELFFRGSTGYRDLTGWIRHELDIVSDAAEESGADPLAVRLDGLPIGGFEYTDRIYVRTAPGPDAGRVVAWVHGLPPGWSHALHQDTVIPLADDLYAAFAALRLDQDPLDTGDHTHSTGAGFLDFLARARGAGLDPTLADRLLEHYREAVIDWRELLDSGRLADDARAARAALQHAVVADDAALVARIAAADVDLDAAVTGSARATDLAVVHGAEAALGALLDSDAAVAADALDTVNSALPPELVRRLLEHGARPSPQAVTLCVLHGAGESAYVLLEALGDRAEEAERHRATAAAELEQTVADVRAGFQHHYLGLDELTRQLSRLSTPS